MSWKQDRAKVAGLSRSRDPNDPDLQNARRDLRAARAEEYIRKLVDAAPPLNPDQLARLAVLLAPSDAGAAA
ncbi:MAG: hypothetical protein JWM64_2070 [Frankiales bacterium]|nr:hypothetical protein [Frankiales bacterium]